jgi:ubiquitin-like modifier-activating enzyme 5
MDERYQRLGLFEFADFSKLREKTALVVGVGGLGAIVSEILVRCGIGKLILMDYDKLELANMNRLIYRPNQVGMPKVEALKQYLQEIGGDTEIRVHPYDVTVDKGYKLFMEECEKSKILFGCVDSFGVRLFMNAKSVEKNRVLVDGGASLDGIKGSVHVVIPGKTACYRCHRHALTMGKREPKGGIATRRDEEELYLQMNEPPKGHETGTCHVTSLPTTMAIIASLQCQEAFKHMLGFGDVANYLMYNGLTGEVKRYDWKTDPNCPVCGGKKEKKMDEKKIDELDKAAEMFDSLSE